MLLSRDEKLEYHIGGSPKEICEFIKTLASDVRIVALVPWYGERQIVYYVLDQSKQILKKSKGK